LSTLAASNEDADLRSTRRTSWRRRLERHALRVWTFFGQAPGSLKRHLNTEELIRITLTSALAGGGLFGLVQALASSTETIFPASTDAALAAAVLTVILETLRRLGHGVEARKEPEPTRARSLR
jgi:hypothetical protein